MLSFRKITFAVLFLIPACGFTPLYTNKNFASLIGTIELQEPTSQDEFVFYSQLNNRFSEDNSKYILNYAIKTSKKDSALSFDGTAHQIEISGSVDFSLKEKGSGLEVLSDKKELSLSYSNFGSTAAVLNAERATGKQLVVLLADKVADRISLTIVEKGS